MSTGNIISFCRLSVTGILICIQTGVYAQQIAPLGDEPKVSPSDSGQTKRIEIINTDVFEFVTTDSNQVRKFTGHVHFRHDGVDFFSSRALQQMDTEIVSAVGNVRISKPDSFEVRSDRLTYYSRSKLASFRGNVSFRDSSTLLYADTLDYDLEGDSAVFSGGARLVDDSSTLVCDRGVYHHGDKEAFFYGAVHLTGKDFDLYADSLRYDTEHEIAYFIAETRVITDGDEIICSSGFYDVMNGVAKFGANTQMVNDGKIIMADDIEYDKSSGRGRASGNVVWEDTAEGIIILANYTEYADSMDHVLATGDPLLIDMNDEDTLYLSGDTLMTYRMVSPVHRSEQTARADTQVTDSTGRSVRKLFGSVDLSEQDTVAGSGNEEDTPGLNRTTPDSVRIFIAYRNVRFLQGRASGMSDSLYFSHLDSVFRMYYQPMVWVDTTQFSGDSMHMELRGKSAERIDIYQDAMIIRQSKRSIFDQTLGKRITGYFESGDLEQMEVDGNGESIYFIQDDSSAYVGGNRTICSRMIIYMSDSTDDVDRITFLTKPEATFTPFQQINLSSYRLDGFRWELEQKPENVYDIVRFLPLYEYFLQREAEKKPGIEQPVTPADGGLSSSGPEH